MHAYSRAIPRSVAAWILIGQLVMACTAREPAPIPVIEAEEPTLPIRHVLVTPFYDMAEIFGPHTGVRGPFSDQIFVTGRIDPLVGDFLTRDLIELLGRQYPDLQISRAKTRIFDFEPHPGESRKGEQLSAVRQAGRQRSADAVLVGFVYDYQEREGGALGVREPAHLAFELNLIGVASGRLLWQRQFQEVQKPLNENLLLLPKFLRRGGRWVPVREMAQDALQQMLKSIPQTD